MRRGWERLSLGHSECSMESGRCYSSYYSCYCCCLYAEQQKALIFEHRLQLLAFPGGFQWWGHYNLSHWGWRHFYLPFPPSTPTPAMSARLIPLRKVFAVAFVTGIQQCSHHATLKGPGPLPEKWQSESENSQRQHQPPLYCPSNSALAPNSHRLLDHTKGLWLTGPPSLDGGLRNIC